jgi:Mrp family chromosome partitioning ATPase
VAQLAGRLREPKSAARLDVNSAIVEGCRAASLKIGGPGLSRLGITSSIRGEGRTSVALAMAIVQQEDYGRSVALLDLDLDNPQLARRIGVRPWPGIAELARGGISLDDVLQPIGKGVVAVAAGAAGAGAPRIITDILRTDLIDRIGRDFDVVIADLPPLLGSSFGHAVAGWFPDLLLVLRSRVTPLARLKEATAHLPVEPKVLLNGTHSDLPRWVRRLAGR